MTCAYKLSFNANLRVLTVSKQSFKKRQLNPSPPLIVVDLTITADQAGECEITLIFSGAARSITSITTSHTVRGVLGILKIFFVDVEVVVVVVEKTKQ